MGEGRSVWLRLRSKLALVLGFLITLVSLTAHPAKGALPTQAQLVYPSDDRVSSDYNEQGCGTSDSSHKGYDFNKGSGDADLGHPIYAAYAGTVVQKVTSSAPGYGNRLIIRHQLASGPPTPSTTKYETLYAHLQSFASGINVGTLVRTGQLIATKGKSGTDFAHLHFELRRKLSDTGSSVTTQTHSISVDSKIGCIGGNPRTGIVVRTLTGIEFSDLWVRTVWYLKNINSAGPHDISVIYGRSNDVLVVGDWNGDGIDTPGVVRCNLWILNNGFDQTFDFQFAYGHENCNDRPVVGDWDGDGVDEPGVVRGITWYLNFNFDGTHDLSCSYGNSTDTFFGGDWNGNGTDTPGVFRGANSWYLNNGCDGAHDIFASYGNAGDVPVAGNWLAQGDRPGVVRGNIWYLNNNFDGTADWSPFAFGESVDTPLVGNWNGLPEDTVGVGRATG